MNRTNNTCTSKNVLLLNCLYVAASVMFFFIATVSILLLIQQRELSSSFPPDFKELEQMKETARTESTNIDLQKKIRKLDLISRSGWFLGHEWQKKAVGLLFAGIVVLIICMNVISAIKPVQIDIKSVKPEKRYPGSEVLALIVLASTCVISVNGFLFFTSAANSATGKTLNTDNAESQLKAEKTSAAEIVTREEFNLNWPSFRGSNNDGVSLVQKPIFGWSKDSQKGILWKTETPLPGFSSPIVWKNQLFITGGDKTHRKIFCYDAATGKLLWEHEATGIPGSPATVPEVSKDTGYAASTPSTDGNRVFAMFATGDLIAVDLQGKRLWAKNLGVPKNMYGYCSSLLTVGNRLVVQYDNEDKQVLYCFDTVTGSTIWQQERKAIISWSSPTLCSFDKKDLIITLNCSEVEAFDLSSGKKEWTQKVMGGEVAPSATCRGSTVFAANENACAAAIDASTGKLLWKNDKAILPDVCSPVVFEDVLFLFTSASAISCLDTSTGKLLWEKDVENGFYSSPIVLKNRIMAFDLKGKMLIIKPDKKELIIEHQESLGEGVLSTPAVVGNKMWVRGSKLLFCLTGTEENSADR
ncbi:MAG: PQQ-binding-like beta-propeller repeat protein [Candidatus Riflebacteria bacterium]|nr:PQQ-binding-like beta-propeller repeat protein [Candidatus Riflebacteria bacterium]